MMIQSRDLEILKTCYEQQFLLMEHVERYYFPGTASQNARKRISELVEAQFLSKEYHPLSGKRCLIRITRLGIACLQQTYPTSVPQVKRIAPATLIHDAIVTSVRLRFKELWDGSWIPERLLKKTEFPQIPDGLVLFESGKRIAIEVENSLKGKQRFLSLMDRWKDTSISLVLYIATQAELAEVIRTYLQAGPKKPLFGLTTWEQLREQTPRPFSTHGELDLFSRRTF